MGGSWRSGVYIDVFQGTRNLLMTALRYSLGLLTGLVVLTAASADEARGRIVQIDPDKKEIRLETRAPVRGVLDLKIDAKTRILIGGQPAKLDDLAPGRRIRVVFQPHDGKPVAQVIRSLGLNLLQPPAAAPPPGVAPKAGEGVTGTLQRVAVTDREIVVIGPGSDGPQTETTIAVPEQTAITREGKKITLDELKEGEAAMVKTEKREGKLTAVSIQVGQAAAARSVAPPRRNLIPRLRQALKIADELLREMEEQRTPPPPPERP
jgi:Cu/Ag efflux protein CusF